jgi:uncharacterized MAPEG superfamily protein
VATIEVLPCVVVAALAPNAANFRVGFALALAAAAVVVVVGRTGETAPASLRWIFCRLLFVRVETQSPGGTSSARTWGRSSMVPKPSTV